MRKWRFLEQTFLRRRWDIEKLTEAERRQLATRSAKTIIDELQKGYGFGCAPPSDRPVLIYGGLAFVFTLCSVAAFASHPYIPFLDYGSLTIAAIFGAIAGRYLRLYHLALRAKQTPSPTPPAPAKTSHNEPIGLVILQSHLSMTDEALVYQTARHFLSTGMRYVIVDLSRSTNPLPAVLRFLVDADKVAKEQGGALFLLSPTEEWKSLLAEFQYTKNRTCDQVFYIITETIQAYRLIGV